MSVSTVQYSAPPRRIADRFRIESEVVSGGMGTIFRATDERTQQTVALKLLRSAPGGESVERFLREGTVLAQLNHSGIVRYIDHGLAEEGNPYLAMEWLNGEDLSRRLQRGILTPHEALQLLRQIAESLALLHRRGIVHRDLKPANLFLRDGRLDQATLLDFGLARAAAHEKSLTKTGMIIGTELKTARWRR